MIRTDYSPKTTSRLLPPLPHTPAPHQEEFSSPEMTPDEEHAPRIVDPVTTQPMSRGPIPLGAPSEHQDPLRSYGALDAQHHEH